MWESLNTDARMFAPPPEMYLSFQEICEKNGFKHEEYEVITQDGYVLKLFRILAQGHILKGPVYFQHGIIDSADCFVMNEGSRALAFVAARNGFDVWLGNIRGNKYSRKHLTMDPDTNSKDFFNYSFVEMANFDITAMIDFIKVLTEYSKVAFIGHSMGTTIMFYLSVQQPKWVEQSISVFVALAPITLPLHGSSLI